MTPFLSRFAFRPQLAGCLGVEREFFLTDATGRPVPGSSAFLEAIDDPAWTYELSACQVEHRTKPHRSLLKLSEDLRRGQREGERVARALGHQLMALEVAPADMPLDVYPDARYLKIVQSLPRETLAAACRVTGVHVHVGVRDMRKAVETSNMLRAELETLAALGDHSGGERLRLYKTMAPTWQPPPYESPEHFERHAIEQGFADNPRNCWHLVRISRHGTVEVRVFGMSGDPEEIIGWCMKIREIIKE